MSGINAEESDYLSFVDEFSDKNDAEQTLG
jgi:hypothetical protein